MTCLNYRIETNVGRMRRTQLSEMKRVTCKIANDLTRGSVPHPCCGTMGNPRACTATANQSPERERRVGGKNPRACAWGSDTCDMFANSGIESVVE
jgi:hypothetical protein